MTERSNQLALDPYHHGVDVLLDTALDAPEGALDDVLLRGHGNEGPLRPLMRVLKGVLANGDVGCPPKAIAQAGKALAFLLEASATLQVKLHGQHTDVH